MGDNTVRPEHRLRSLERRRMYTIFAPLDDDEPLPRELLIEARRHRGLGRREVAGMLWLPGLAAVLYLAALTNMSPIVGLALVLFLLLGLIVFAVSDKRNAWK